MTDLTGQVALVTGASSGLGKHFAEVLAGAGAGVAVAGRRLDRLEEVAASITASGGRALPVQLDVTDAAALGPAVDVIEEELGLVTILVNNAAMPAVSPATDLPVELVDEVLATNVRAPWLLSCEVARRLLARDMPGRVVNISSMGSFHHRGGAPFYSVSKAAVNRITEMLSVEWAASRINVNAIAPASFSSEMMDSVVAKLGDRSGAFPRKRMGEVGDFASTLLYLVAPESEAVTGTIVRVDDGQHGR